MGRPKGRNFEVLLSTPIPAKTDGELASEWKKLGMGSKAAWVRYGILNRRNDNVRKMLKSLDEQERK